MKITHGSAHLGEVDDRVLEDRVLGVGGGEEGEIVGADLVGVLLSWCRYLAQLASALQVW